MQSVFFLCISGKSINLYWYFPLGNIRVYCRIRPVFRDDAKSTIEYIGKDGSLVILDPSKPQKDGRKVFQFNRVFSPTATQGKTSNIIILYIFAIKSDYFCINSWLSDDVFKDTQPLVRSVMDGYNVCIFAYGQTGSGKTHTMVWHLSDLAFANQIFWIYIYLNRFLFFTLDI